MQAIFTIVAKNYIGLAQVLEKSVYAKNSNVVFYIIVADELSHEKRVRFKLESNILFAKEILQFEDSSWNNMAFKYSLVEFCTAIKPASFEYFFNEKKYEKVIYLDPDVFVFNSLDTVFSSLNNTCILLTPHIVSMQTPFKGDYPDHLFLLNGTFNLGFIGLKKSDSSDKLLNWWHNRLLNECFSDNDKGTLTDQKWLNLLPAFYGYADLTISKDIGLNVAPWNYFEREIVLKDETFFVRNRFEENANNIFPLVFVHFSGYDYKNFSNNTILHTNENFTSYPDMQSVFYKYANALKEGHIEKFMNEAYSYGQYNNGINIISIHRRIYRRMTDDGILYANPFETESNSFFDKLKRNKLIDYTKISADKVSNKNLPSFDNKLKMVNTFFSIVKSIIGIRKYSMFIRFLKRFSREENQAFLIDKSFGNKLK